MAIEGTGPPTGTEFLLRDKRGNIVAAGCVPYNNAKQAECQCHN